MDASTLKMDQATNSKERRDGIRVSGRSEIVEGPVLWSSICGQALILDFVASAHVFRHTFERKGSERAAGS